MLLGYDKKGNIKFLFTDSNYLAKRYPDNSAKISDFWKGIDHGLTEFFTTPTEFPDFQEYKNYKIVDNKIIKKPKEAIREVKSKVVSRSYIGKELTF